MTLNLRQKLILLIMLVVIPLVIVVGYNLLHLFNDLQNDEIDDRLRDARLIAANIDEFALDLVREGNAAGLAIVDGGLERGEADVYLRDLKRQMPVLDLAFVLPNGRVFVSTSPTLAALDFAPEEGFREVAAGGDSSFRILRLQDPAVRSLAAFTRIVRQGRFSGAMLVTVRLEDLGDTVSRDLPGGIVVITDADGRLASTNRPEIVRRLGREANLSSFPGVRAAGRGEEFTTASVELPGLAGRYLGAQVPVESLGWTAGVYNRVGEALSHVFREAVATTAVILGVLLISLLATRYYGRKWISVPVTKLSRASREIGAGNFDIEIDVRSRDEIGQLAGNLRKMQQSLSHAFNDARLLSTAARRVNSSLDRVSVARTAVEYLERILSGSDVIVSGLDEELSEMIVLAASLQEEEARNVAHVLGRVAAHTDFAEAGWAVVQVNEKLAGQLARYAEPPRFIVMLPLSVGDVNVGRIDVLASPSASLVEFERSDVALAASFAQQVAIALENARIFQRQRRIADALQDSLLTRPYPIAGTRIGIVYRPAVGGRVGGDFYDFIPAKGGKTAIVIGDISGSGIEAARLTAVAKGAIHSFALESPLPAFVLARANRVIVEQIGIDSFITAAYILLDPRTGNLEYSIAGHPTPLLFHADTKKIVRFNPGGLPLGIDERTVYSNQRLNLARGDRLLLYTDGLSEARRNSAFFGEERIIESLSRHGDSPAQELAERLVEEATDFARGRIADDLALVVIERE
ncbi:MAG: HAMP domain-containing protein [Actinobacteria bacterium]|nr:MAG: HAMP domain-containing protein [Actinomycetota bacterium]